MNKIFLLFLSVLFIGCSKSDDNSSAPAKNTIKHISETVYYSSNSSDTNSATFNYENGILKNITEDGSNRKGEFIYDGDKIINYNYYEANTLMSSYTISYNGTMLTSMLTDESLSNYQYIDGKVSSYQYLAGSGTNYTLYEEENYEYTNNNVVVVNGTRYYASTPSYYKWGYDYDSKNDLLKNMNPYLKFIFKFESTTPFSQNNALVGYTYNSSNARVQDYTYQITYNSDNFPTNIKKYSTDSTGAIVRLISDLTVEYN